MTSQIGGWFSLCRCCFIQYSRLNTFEAPSHFLPGLAINSCRDQDPWRTVSSTPVASRPRRAGRALWKRLQDLQVVVGFGMPCCVWTASLIPMYSHPETRSKKLRSSSTPSTGVYICNYIYDILYTWYYIYIYMNSYIYYIHYLYYIYIILYIYIYILYCILEIILIYFTYIYIYIYISVYNIYILFRFSQICKHNCSIWYIIYIKYVMYIVSQILNIVYKFLIIIC